MLTTVDGSVPAAATSREISIPAEDGRLLAATLFEPPHDARGRAPLTIIAGGAGIARRYYARFATYLAERGRTAVTFDYRDVGGSRTGSLKGSQVRMRDWCTLDVPGLLAWAGREFPDQPIHWLGHSMGGFATGLAHNNRLIARQLNIATLNGYWGRMASPERYRVRVLMGLVGVPVARAIGYLPGFLMGGEDMPGPAFIEWAGWCMTPEFLFGDATLTEKSNFMRFRAPIRFAQIEDDVWGRRPPSSTSPSISRQASITRSGPFASATPAPPGSATTASSVTSSATPCGPPQSIGWTA